MSSDRSINAVQFKQCTRIYRLYARPLDRLLELFPKTPSRHRKKIALDQISLEIERGEVFGLIGRNGAGKSTLLQLLAGTLRPTSGSVKRDGRVAALLELGAGFNPEFSGRENIYLYASVLGLSPDEITERVPEIIAFSELDTVIDDAVKTYSSGMFVRLAFATATCVSPDILVIDEALSVGDGAFAYKSFQRIMELKDQGVTIIFCSHSLYQVESLCDRACWLDHGRVMALGPAEQVCKQYQTALDRGTAEIDQPNDIEQHQPGTDEQTDRGSPRLQRVTVQGEKKARIETGAEALELDVQFHRYSHPEPLGLGVVIETEAGHQVCSFSTIIDEIPLITGEHLKLTIQDFPLLKGRYTIDVFLLCDRGLHVFDAARQCIQLDVSTTHHEVGVVSLPRRWDINPC